jgi:acid phosphatase
MQSPPNALALFFLAAVAFAAQPARAAGGLPRPARVVIVIEENHSYRQIIGSAAAPYLNRLAGSGANFTNAHGITHPSAPNYFALFAGRPVAGGDDCPARGIAATDPNLGRQLLAAHLGYIAYSESLPSAGFSGCWAGTYARKHAPWAQFTNLPRAAHQPLSALRTYATLPAVTFIVPNVDHDMHDGSVKAGDDWFKRNVGPLAKWAKTNDTLLIVTWDEGFDPRNTIPTIFYGPMVKPGNYAEPMNAYVILRTIEDMYGLAPLGHAASATAVRDVWLKP